MALKISGAIAALLLLALSARQLTLPQPVYACTGGWGSFEEYARAADAVAVVQVLSAGDARNAAPSVTPSALYLGASQPLLSPSGTPLAGAGAPPSPNVLPYGLARALTLPATSPQLPFDLTGFGARLRVEQMVAGILPSEFDVDAAVRQGLEKQLRVMEANPGAISPCPLGFGMLTYMPGERLLLFLRRDANDKTQWDGTVRLSLTGDAAVNSMVYPGGTSYPILTVSTEVRGAFFADLPADSLPSNSESETPKMSGLWSIKADSVPVTRLVAAAQAIRIGAPILPLRPPIDPDPTLSPAVPRLRPPDTGDGGLAVVLID